MEWTKNDYLICTDPALLDIEVIYEYLNVSYWAAARPKEVIEKSIANSLCFGVYHTEHSKQVGFSRVVTDQATVFWLGDVFILPEYQGRGLGKWLPGFLINKVFRRSRHKPRRCSKLPQVACNAAPVEKSINPEGELFDFKRKTHCYLR